MPQAFGSVILPPDKIRGVVWFCFISTAKTTVISYLSYLISWSGTAVYLQVAFYLFLAQRSTRLSSSAEARIDLASM
jgi:hypothetical protein